MKTKTLKNKNTVMLITLGIVAVVLVLLAIIGNMRKGGKGTEPVVEVISVEKETFVRKSKHPAMWRVNGKKHFILR